MPPNERSEPSEESLRVAMDQAWRDHHHARDQTWRTLQIEAVLGAGLVSVDAQFRAPLATTAAGLLVVLVAVLGVLVSLNHRKLERRKFIHIMNCEEKLGLHRDDVIPIAAEDPANDKRPLHIRDGSVALPATFSLWRCFDPRFNNTAVFILRMHAAIILFALLMIVFRVWTGGPPLAQ